MNKSISSGGFTIPGEEGYEALTLSLIKKWGADAIRDSDGTKLSDELINSGLNVYSTICLIREHNEWAKKNPKYLQQNFLMTLPVIAQSETVTIDLLYGYFKEQFRVNFDDDPRKYWQVFDRTLNKEILDWNYDATKGTVTVENTRINHSYTVNFLVYRIWEEISMYNHITNDWGDKEHKVAINPIYPEAQEEILNGLKLWLDKHPNTTYVRLTSMFYNGAWFWGDETKARHLYGDNAGYDFTVCPYALELFEKEYGYALCSEDFVNCGNYNPSHNIPTQKYRDWMDFINKFVVNFGSRCVELIHSYGKKAIMFYNDSWIGTEPYSERFKDFKFDGIVDGIFNGFEARKTAGVSDVELHEFRLHPYFFPVGVNGEPSFLEGGNPTLECKNYWINIRRACMRVGAQRIGFGGYLHLLEGFDEFADYVGVLADEFRSLRDLHIKTKPYTAPIKVAILTYWGKLRSWTYCGHFDKNSSFNAILESLSGLPVDVCFISFDDIINGDVDNDINVIINAGTADSTWSGGELWGNEKVINYIYDFVANGGGFIGVEEPSAYYFGGKHFQTAEILGVDSEIGRSTNNGKYICKNIEDDHYFAENFNKINIKDYNKKAYIYSADTRVICSDSGIPVITINNFGKGRAMYFGGYNYNADNTAFLLKSLYYITGNEDLYIKQRSNNVNVEFAVFGNRICIINNSLEKQQANIVFNNNNISVTLKPAEMNIIDIKN